MELAYSVPTAGMAATLSVIGHVDRVGTMVRDFVPALLPNLHIRLRGSARYAFGAGPWQPVPAVALLGPTNAAFRVELSGDCELICVGLLPEGWRDCVGVPCCDLADTMIDAADLWPARLVEDLLCRVAEGRDLTARRAAVEAFLAGRRHSRRQADWRRIAATRLWLEQPGAISLDLLASRINVSARQLARLTLDGYGASPKTLAMKYRALRAAGTLTVKGRAGMAEALAGYADQSHLIRDFHRFVGCTPGRFVEERRALAHATMLGRWNAGARSRITLCS